MNSKFETHKKLLLISIPIMLSNLISQVQMLIDRIFLGQLDITAMSAVSNASSPIWTTMNFVFSLAIGSNILISQAIGAGEKELAKKRMAALFKYANVFSVFLFVIWMFLPRQIFTLMGAAPEIMNDCVAYARCSAPVFLLLGLGSAISTMLQVSEKTGIMIWYGLVRSLVNIFLDYCLIFGNLGFPRLEVAGAALATAIAEIVGDVLILVYVLINKKLWIKPAMKEIFVATLKPYIDSVKMGLPTACEDLAWNSGSLFLIVMLNQISKEASGIYSIIFGMELLPVCVISSMGTGVLTLSGQETGRENLKGVMKVVKIALSWAAVIAGIVLVCFILFPETITGWFTKDINVILASSLYLVIVGIDLFPKSGNILVGAGIKGYGDTKWMLTTQIFGTIFVIGGSALLVLVFHQGIEALFMLVVADETLRCIVNTIRLNYIVRRNKISCSNSMAN